MAEQFEREEEKTPVFVINGFLEAGKTQFLRFTMEQPYFQAEGKTLLLVCEEGEEEYPEDFLSTIRRPFILRVRKSARKRRSAHSAKSFIRSVS